MSSIFNLLQHARIRLATNDPEFHNTTDTVVAILKSSGVLPIRRASVNFTLHKLDLSRFDSAPLIAFTATKETDYGTETNRRI